LVHLLYQVSQPIGSNAAVEAIHDAASMSFERRLTESTCRSGA
jgi:hypothetical protein